METLVMRGIPIQKKYRGFTDNGILACPMLLYTELQHLPGYIHTPIENVSIDFLLMLYVYALYINLH